MIPRMKRAISSAVRAHSIVLSLLFAIFLAGCSTLGASKPVHHMLPGAMGAGLPFSHLVEVGDTVHVAGTLGLDPETGRAPADPAQEVRLMLDEIRAKLALVGLDMDDLVSVQVFCSDVELYGTFNDIYRTYFEGAFPARSFIGSGPLLRGCRFEMNGVAVK